MSERDHGRRYSFTEKKEILSYLERNTYKDTSEKYGISETTLSRWKKAIKSGSKKNRSKIIISLPKFWLEYLNDQIESDVWENYSEAFLSILRDYFRNQKTIENADSKYLKNVKEILPNLVNLNPNIDSMLLFSSNEVIYKTERWISTKGISNLIESWKKALLLLKKNYWFKNRDKSGNLKSFEYQEFKFQNEMYYIRDISVKHLLGVKKSQRSTYLLALKKKLTENDVYILAIAKATDDNSMLHAMNSLKRVAMGVLAPINEVIRDDPYKKLKEMLTRVPDSVHIQENRKEWERVFQIKMNTYLMQLASYVNKSLKPEEKEVLEAIEKQLGKTIERITADPEQETSKRKLWEIPWINPDMEFPSKKFPCHYIALNGEIILLSLVNLGLLELPSEILNLTHLTYLCLNSNNITQLPKTISNLKSLEILKLDNNQFTKVSDSIIELPRLQNLYMRNNKISKIPVALTDAWQARIEDQSYQRSIYIPCNLIFSGNPIERNSLSKDQLDLLTSKSFRVYSEKLFLII